MPLSPYQYQLGSVVFGRDTQIPVSKVDIQAYNVNVQDFQVVRTDENRFGIDTLAPGPIIFTMAVLENFYDESVANFNKYRPIPTPDDLFAAKGTHLPRLAKEWKANEIRPHWGIMKPLLCSDGEGVIRRIYGRPGKFMHAPRYNDNTMWIDVQAEFRRGDTYAHHDTEYFVGPIAPNGAPVTADRDDGDADSWLRVLLYGPATHPVVQYGGSTIEFDLTIAAGVVVEISSYPWQRRVVDSEGINHRARIIGATQYLDQIKFLAGATIPLSWTASGIDGNSEMFFLWREAYNVV